MQLSLIVIGIITGAIFFWAMSTQRRLVVLEENINSAMSQIGVQLSCRFNALTALLHITKEYAGQESKMLIEAIESARRDITAKSTPDDVLSQECIIGEVLGRIFKVSEQYPELEANDNYVKTMDAVETYEHMLRTSRLIYNNSVNKLNREIRMLPVSIIAGMLGFSAKKYAETQSAKLENGIAH
ncbi:MAG: LemA family protein [Treponema sp.]|nr:LemA family protein [Treponema sp.]